MLKIALVHSHDLMIYDEIARHTPDGFKTVSVDIRTPLEEQITLASDTKYMMLAGTELPDEVLRAAQPHLLQILSAGWDFLNSELIQDLEIQVANNGGANSWAVADHTVLLILGVLHRLIEADSDTRSGRWRERLDGTNAFELANKTVGILGIGNIGRQVAKRIRAFDAQVIYHDAIRLPESEERELGLTRVEIKDLFVSSDVLTIHVPLIPGTRKLVSRELINLMKPSAILVNTARGGLIDEQSLIEALANGRISGAGLDVFETEPVRTDNPLLKMTNVIVTPHSAGSNWDAWSRRASFGYANIARVQRGGSPKGLIKL